MKSNFQSFLAKGIGAGVLALSLSVLPSTLPASAQTTDVDPTVPGGTVTEVETDDGFDWGWLGLLGLIGLAGLKKRDREVDTRYRDRDRVTTSTTDPRY